MDADIVRCLLRHDRSVGGGPWSPSADGRAGVRVLMDKCNINKHFSPPYFSCAYVIGGGNGNRYDNIQRRGSDSSVCADWVVRRRMATQHGSRGRNRGSPRRECRWFNVSPIPPTSPQTHPPLISFFFLPLLHFPLFPPLSFLLFFSFLSTEKRNFFFFTNIAWRQSTARASSA